MNNTVFTYQRTENAYPVLGRQGHQKMISLFSSYQTENEFIDNIEVKGVIIYQRPSAYAMVYYSVFFGHQLRPLTISNVFVNDLLIHDVDDRGGENSFGIISTLIVSDVKVTNSRFRMQTLPQYP